MEKNAAPQKLDRRWFLYFLSLDQQKGPWLVVMMTGVWQSHWKRSYAFWLCGQNQPLGHIMFLPKALTWLGHPHWVCSAQRHKIRAVLEAHFWSLRLQTLCEKHMFFQHPSLPLTLFLCASLWASLTGFPPDTKTTMYGQTDKLRPMPCHKKPIPVILILLQKVLIPPLTPEMKHMCASYYLTYILYTLHDSPLTL